MTKKPGQTILNRDNRQRILAAHIAHREAQGKPELTIDEMQKLLRTAGYGVSRATIYLDLSELARDDPFITDLASKTYSKIMHDCYNHYRMIFRESMKVYNADIHNERTINRGSGNAPGIDVITEKSAQAKTQALNLAKQATDSIRLMINGENLRISSSKWVQTAKAQQFQIERLKEKLKQYEKDLPQITQTPDTTLE